MTGRHIDPALERILKRQESADTMTPTGPPVDELAPFRFPDGTIDVDALELGRPSPGFIGFGAEAPNYATGRPATAPSYFLEEGDGWAAIQGPAMSPAMQAARITSAGPSIEDLEEWADESLEASRARRQEGAGGAWLVGLALLAGLAICAFVLLAAGIVGA